MPAAGELRERFSFFIVPEESGTMGGKRGEPQRQFTVWGKFLPLRGGEEVMAARLQSKQPAIITVRQTSQTRLVTTDWQIQDSAGVFYNIRTITDPDRKRAWFDMLVDSGGAA